MPQTSQKFARDLFFAFDVGHSSIGWAVLRIHESGKIEVLGCGTVIFQADDCLAFQRRMFRRQRRNIRATRRRISRIAAMLNLILPREESSLAEELALYSKANELRRGELTKKGHGAPWLLAARVLKSNGERLLTWPQLWNVLRWYAHNRGYDGNKAWSRQEDAGESDRDTEKVEIAKRLLSEYGTRTMAETWCAICGLDPLGEKISASFEDPKDRPKAREAAFPRSLVENEVRRVLDAHIGKLPGVDERFVKVLMNDWRAIPCDEIHLPARYQGGLLFGQLVPRFENRIVGTCPVSGEKTPSRRSREFLDFRWMDVLRRVRVARLSDEELRPLDAAERIQLDRRARVLGFFRYEPDKVDKKTGAIKRGVNELREVLVEEMGFDRDNLEDLLFDDNMREALKVLPVEGDAQAFRIAWVAFDGPTHDASGEYVPDRLAGRFITQLLRGKVDSPIRLTPFRLIEELEKLGEKERADRIRQQLKEAATKREKIDEAKLAKLGNAEFGLARLSGRARFGRTVMRAAVQQWMHRDHPIDPFGKGGVVEQTSERQEAERAKRLDELTNNHLVRHRLRILAGDPHAEPKPFDGLLDDLVKTYANGDWTRISRIAVEVARDLQEMSGKTTKDRKAAQSQKLEQHQRAADALAAAMREEGISFVEEDGRPRFSASLIRKARIALDLEDREESKKRKVLAYRCPYTGRHYELTDILRRGRLELDHIVPRSKRLSDALEAMVLTSPEINREKKNRTALEFIRDMNRPENEAKRQKLGVLTERQYLEFVDSLEPKKDPFRRAKALGERPSDDDARRWRRKELLKVAKWDKQEFTPASLTVTRHLTKLAVQRIESRFPQECRPPVVVVPGAVTHVFRDRAWRLLPLLIDRKDTENKSMVNVVFVQRKKALDAGKDFNLKKALREVTHLHHAVDAAAVGLVLAMVTGPNAMSLDGRLAQLLIKRKLNAEERREFETIVQRLQLPKFYRWRKAKEGDDEILIDDLPKELKEQLHARLMERRVVQHIPKDKRGMPVDQKMWRLRGWNEDGTAQLEQKDRDPKTGRRVAKVPKQGADRPSRLIGWEPEGGSGKLKSIKAVLITNANFGLALDPAPEVIPFHKVSVRLRELRKKNGGKPVRILRNGHLIRVVEKSSSQIWRVFSIKNSSRGIMLDLGRPDAKGPSRNGNRITSFLKAGIEIIDAGYCGIDGSSVGADTETKGAL